MEKYGSGPMQLFAMFQNKLNILEGDVPLRHALPGVIGWNILPKISWTTHNHLQIVKGDGKILLL